MFPQGSLALLIALVAITAACAASAASAAVFPSGTPTAHPPHLSARAAAACRARSYRIVGRVGVSCSTAGRVLSRYLDGGSTRGWSCSRSRRECTGSGLSIDEYRYFRFR